MKRLSIIKMKLSPAHYQYRRKKKELLDKFSSISVWGNWISMRRLNAIAELFNYLDETRDLIEEDEDLKEVIYKDHVTLLLGKLTSMPADLKGSMVSSISDQLHLSNKEKFEDLYFSLKTKQRVSTDVFIDLASIGQVSASCEGIAMEHADVGDSAAEIDFGHVSAKLRRMRGCLYKKSKSGVYVSQDLLDYQCEVESFIEKFGDELSEAEYSIWTEKVKKTTTDVIENIKKNEAKVHPNETEDNEPEPEISTSYYGGELDKLLSIPRIS